MLLFPWTSPVEQDKNMQCNVFHLLDVSLLSMSTVLQGEGFEYQEQQHVERLNQIQAWGTEPSASHSVVPIRCDKAILCFNRR